MRERFGLTELSADMFADVADAVGAREPGEDHLSDRAYAEFVHAFGEKHGLGHA